MHLAEAFARGLGRRALCLLSVLVLPVAFLSACGGGSGAAVVMSVGGISIEKTTVAHWTRVFALGGPTSNAGEETRGSARTRALSFLIAMDWLIAEAAREGVSPPRSVVDREFRDRKAANGLSEFEEQLRAIGQTTSDARFEIEAELAAKAIGRRLLARAADVTQGDVLGYYRRNISRFRVGEKRMTDLIENLPSPAAAIALVKRIGTGARFAGRALHESLEQETGANVEHDKAEILRAIFAARPGVAGMPMKLNGLWTMFVVRRVIPARVEPLSAARAKAETLLIAKRTRTLTAAFLKSYRSRWTARTSCHTGYVVPGCSQYAGPLQAVVSPLLKAELGAS
jgi:hypothetical protein